MTGTRLEAGICPIGSIHGIFWINPLTRMLAHHQDSYIFSREFRGQTFHLPLSQEGSELILIIYIISPMDPMGPMGSRTQLQEPPLKTFGVQVMWGRQLVSSWGGWKVDEFLRNVRLKHLIYFILKVGPNHHKWSWSSRSESFGIKWACLSLSQVSFPRWLGLRCFWTEIPLWTVRFHWIWV